jgi:hypothetical protein
MPPTKTGEAMADISGNTSRNESSKVGLDLLEGFLNALGPVGLGSKVKGTYERDNKQTIKFTFTNPLRDSVDVILLGSQLANGYTFNEKNALYAEGRRYFIVTGVAKSSSISIIAEGDQKQLMDVDAEVKQLVSASGGVSIETSGSGQITFKGTKNLAFGVEISELKYDTEQQRFLMSSVNEPRKLRGPSSITKGKFIGDPMEGNAFVTLSN